jgi:acetate---CoA ligase (ADP-forming)
VVTTTGGGAAAVVDRLGLHGIELSSMNDLTMTATAGTYAQTLERLLASAECDAVLAAVGSSAQFHPELAVQPILDAQRVQKPVAAFLTPHAERSLSLLASKGVPAFRTPEACADAFAAYFAWRAPRIAPDLPSFTLKECDSFQWLRELGIPVAEHAMVEAPQFAHPLAYPVALKRLDLEHKTEAGGVVLDVQSGMEVRAHARRMGQARYLVQRMERGLAEALVGYRDDPVAGPLVLVGAGGTLAEIYRDFALACAPVSESEALAMIERVKGLAPIRGYRNLPRGDLAALARAVSAMSRLALIPGRPVAEAEANPLIVKRQGVVAVDARMALKK